MIKQDMMKGNTINFKDLRKRSPGNAISVMESLLRCNGLSNNPEIKHKRKICEFIVN